MNNINTSLSATPKSRQVAKCLIFKHLPPLQLIDNQWVTAFLCMFDWLSVGCVFAFKDFFTTKFHKGCSQSFTEKVLCLKVLCLTVSHLTSQSLKSQKI